MFPYQVRSLHFAGVGNDRERGDLFEIVLSVLLADFLDAEQTARGRHRSAVNLNVRPAKR